MRNSTCKPDLRELSDGVRQQKECLELTSERLSQIFYIIEESRCRRSPCRYKGKDIKNQMIPYPASV